MTDKPLKGVPVVILAGGRGSRLADQIDAPPKPMVEIGGHPIIWHIMKHYAHFGAEDFIVCLGYKGFFIKDYFANYLLHRHDVIIDLIDNKITYHGAQDDRWRIKLIDTGIDTQTGGRVKRVENHIDSDLFCLTYGDGLSDIDLGAQLAFHRSHGRLATVTAVRPPGRFGSLELSGDRVTEFREKPEAGWINGGFFILSRAIMPRIDGDATVWERGPLETLARDGELAAFQHRGFWHPMDTPRDRQQLEELWKGGNAPWRTWN